jgi:GABA(A) receptor-associated protein
MISNFKDSHSFQNRLHESTRIIHKYPDRIPIICEKKHNDKNIPDIDKQKYLVSKELTIGQFIYVIRKRIQINSDEAIFLFTNGIIPPSSSTIGAIYDVYKDNDLFIYFTYTKENTFGL